MDKEITVGTLYVHV